MLKKRGTDIEQSILQISKENNDILPELDANLIALALNAEEVKSKLSTHVIISEPYHLRLLKGNDRNLHIASKYYLSLPYSMIYHKNLSLSVAEPLENM